RGELMSTISEKRAAIRAEVEPLLEPGEELSVTAGPSEYKGGLTTLRFNVLVLATPERLDDLLEPEGGIRQALTATVTRSSGHRPVRTPEGERTGVEWTVEYLI